MKSEDIHKDNFHSKGWPALVSITMVLSGCACFILGCVAAMIITNRER